MHYRNILKRKYYSIFSKNTNVNIAKDIETNVI